MEASNEKPKTALGRRIAALSLAKRALLEQALARKSGLPPGDGSSTVAFDSTPVALPPQTDNHSASQPPPPMSYGQQGMWLLHQTLPDPAAYNSTVAWRLAGQVDPEIVRRCFQVIQARHEILRTALVQQETNLVQLIQPAEAVSLSWQTWDLRSGPADQQEAVLEDRLRAEFRRPFDLAQAPLWRVVWVNLGEARHVLACVFHHSIMDEWSMRLFVGEFSALYAAGGDARSAGLPELPMQYADYAIWQRQRLTGKFLEQRQAYWREQLRDLPPTLELPTDFPRPVQPSGRGAIHRFQITGTVVTRFRELARANHTTLFTVALAAYQVWLYRYTGQKDIVVGTPITGRERPEVQALLGYFLNTLSVRTRLDGSQTFQELIKDLRATVLDAFSHAELPFEQTVELVVKERKPDLQPLYQVMFVLLEEGLSQLKLGDVCAEPFSVGTHASKNDLIWSITAGGHAWDCQLEYARDLFSPESVAHMARHLTGLLESIAADSQQVISRLSLMSEPERHQLLVEWNATGQPYPKDKCIHELFEEQAARTPDAVALVFGKNALTYRQLNERANQLAHHLGNLGVKPETLVGLHVERSLELVVGILGILKAGGAYVPMDPVYPPERLAHMVEDARAPVVVTQESLAVKVTSANSKLVCLDSDWPEISGRPTTNPRCPVQPDQLAYVIYTSGSTGKPKGSLITHYNVVRLFQATQDWFHFDQTDVWTLFHSSAFDFSVWEIWGALFYGGRLVVVPFDISRAPEALHRLLHDEGVTVLNQTPSAFSQLIRVDVERQGKASPSPLALRWVIFGGEALDFQGLKPWFDRHGDQQPQPVNMYGITETTVHVTYRPIREKDTDGGSVIGRPIPDLRVYLLDEQQQLVPIGVPGEICVGGAGIGRGYLNQPGLTAEKFVPDPFDPEPGHRLYRSGDLGRFLPNGELEYLGRIDQQVKIRGFRIELGEIETVLVEHPAIRECVVVAQNQTGAENRMLVAYLVAQNGSTPTVAELRKFLLKKLPDYMVPGAFVNLEKLPLTANGKLDRRALPSPGENRLASGAQFIGPRTPMEVELANIWCELLGLERVGVQDNFFNLGGQSLLAMVMSSHIKRRLGVEMPLRWAFEHPTIERLAGQLENLAGSSHLHSVIAKVDRHQPLPMSFSQQGMWLLQETLPDPTAYNLSVAWQFSGRLDRKKIQRSLRTIQERHEVLRTALVQQDGNLVQVIQSTTAVQFPWQELDLQSVPEDQQPVALQEQLQKEARFPFDLTRAPLWRVVWVQLNPTEQVLAFTFHHSIVDEWSLRLFMEELEQLYAAGRPPELPVQYADYAAWQRLRLTDCFLERHQNYWKEQLRELPPALELPTDLSRPPKPSGRGASHHFQIAGRVVTKFRELAHAENTTLFTVVLAAFQVWLHRYTGQTDLVVGTPISGRERPEVQKLIGFFLNTLPILVKLDGARSFRDVVRQVRDTLLDAFSHAELPFEQMVKLAVREREANRQPLYQAMFVLLEEGLSPLRLDNKCARRLSMNTQTSKCDLIFSVQATEVSWNCGLEYATDLFCAESVTRMARHLTELIGSIAENPEQAIDRLRLMPAMEHGQILGNWNQTGREYPRDNCIHELFDEQVHRAPEAVAVVFADQRLTYRELNERANQLAHHLRSLGVGAKTLVGVHVDRSIEYVVSVLAVLKAGGAYVPLDPAYPASRIQFMVADAAIRILLTNQPMAQELDLQNIVVVDVATENSALQSGSRLNPEWVNTADHPAYVIYTSGSTGLPKGVVIPHRGVVRLVRNQDYAEFDSHQRFLLLASTSFDATTFELWGALLNGAVCVIFPKQLESFEQLESVVRQHGVTCLWLTAGLFNQIIDARPSVLETVAHVLTGGEALSVAHVKKARELMPSLRLTNGYGPTESTTFACCYAVKKGDEFSHGSVPIGRPIANTRCYILDPHQQPVPIGVTGELYIGDDGLAIGYLNRPELTAEKFIADPFSNKPGARLYKTGDLCRYLPDGNIEFLGRLDQQVKLRGFRIELGEIEAVLGTHPSILNAVVVAREDAPGIKQLVSYLVTREKTVPTVSEIREFLLKKLPDYMVPSAFVMLDELPLTPNGKIDRKALPPPTTNREVSTDEDTQPTSLLELELLRIWRRLFQREDIGRHDNFFALGGHSLMAARLASEVEKLLGHRIPVTSLFHSPTLKLLARRLSDENWVPAWSSLVPLQPQGDKRPIFFVHGWGGNVFGYLQLAKLLPADQPCYGIQAVGLEGESPRHTSVEDMAAHYVQEIVSFQPEGPIYLAGFSMAGLIAYEIAQQLHRRGRTVAMLGILDSSPVGKIPWGLYALKMAYYIPKRFLFHLQRWTKLAPRERLEYLLGRWKALRYWLSRNFIKSSPISTPPPKGVEKPQVPGFEDYYVAVAAGYQLKPYPGSADIFFSDNTDSGWKWYWRFMVRGDITFYHVEGNHNQLIFSQEHTAGLAKALTTALHAAQQKD